ncbi:uncharacterized protein LOC144004186 [Festucalex cinctus]
MDEHGDKVLTRKMTSSPNTTWRRLLKGTTLLMNHVTRQRKWKERRLVFQIRTAARVKSSMWSLGSFSSLVNLKQTFLIVMWTVGLIQVLQGSNLTQVQHSVAWQSTHKEKVKRGWQVSGSKEVWQKLQPEVDCGDTAMTLTVRRRQAVQLLVDRAENESSIHLSQLPPHCGYSVETTWRDLSLIAQYDACHVTQQGDSYVLRQLWRGTPVKRSCPVSRVKPSMIPLSLCCSLHHGMDVRLSATQELRINVGGEWTPVLLLVQQCGYTWDRQDTDMLIATPFITCGMTVKSVDWGFFFRYQTL